MLITFKPKSIFQILRCRWLGLTNTYMLAKTYIFASGGNFQDPRTGFFKFKSNFIIFNVFEILYQFSDFYPQEDPSGSPQALKVIIWKIIITFKPKTKSPIQILRCRWLTLTKTCNFVSGSNSPRVTQGQTGIFMFFMVFYAQIYAVFSSF